MTIHGAMVARRYRAAMKANAAAEEEGRAHRAFDPVELAKRFVRTRGVVVYSEAVNGGQADLFVIGTQRRQTARNLITLAEQLGFTTMERKNGKNTTRKARRQAVGAGS